MQGENERQWKKVNENTYDISSIKSKPHVILILKVMLHGTIRNNDF